MKNTENTLFWHFCETVDFRRKTIPWAKEIREPNGGKYSANRMVSKDRARKRKNPNIKKNSIQF
jgi:hypothetical protein